MEKYRDLYHAAGGRSLSGHLYGIVYYFVRGFRPETDVDAGNVAKRVWDALEGMAYEDDQVVRLQLSGIVDTGPIRAGEVAYEELDLTQVPREALARVLELLAAEEPRFLYVELGALRSSMFTFNLAGRGAAS
jgi:hypothetical protein